MYIITASNDQYAQHLGVMLTSLLENTSPNWEIHIYIIDGDLSDPVKSKLQRIVERFQKSLTFLEVDQELFKSFTMNPDLEYISQETYYRIIIPDLLSEEISKVLYLDCDLIVKKDISKLWKVDITNHYLAAVDTAYYLSEKKRKKRNKSLSLPKDSHYFNAGVLLLNLDKWRKKKISKKLIDLIQQQPDKLKLMDQDALNIVLHEKWLQLDPKWNFTSVHYKAMPSEKPAIIHFNGRKKPWNSDHPFKEEYLKYLKSSLWDQG